MEEGVISSVKVKEEYEEDLEQAFNEIMGQEEIITDEMIQSELIKNEILFEDINGDKVLGDSAAKEEQIEDINGDKVLGDSAVREEQNNVSHRDSQFQRLLKKYSSLRKTGSKNRWLCFKYSSARKEKALRVKRNGSAKFNVQKSKSKKRKGKKRKQEKSSEKPDEDCQVQQVELKQPKQEPADVEECNDTDQGSNAVSSDNLLYCDECSRLWEGDCTVHGPLLVVEDTPFPDDIDDKNRAEKTSPAQVVISNTEAEKGVWAREVLPARTRFGPYDGKVVPAEVCTAYSWVIFKNGEPDYCIDATEPSLSNWMRFVNCARHNGQQNLHAFQHQGKVYYRTIRKIDPGEELLVWFDKEYGRLLGTDCESGDGKCLIEVCPDCPYPCASPKFLLEHKKLSHGDLGTSSKRAKEVNENNSLSRGDRRSYSRSAKSSVSYSETPGCKPGRFPEAAVNVDNIKPTKNPKTGEKCYACPECNKLILRRSHLKRHMLIHSNVKPYVCEFCNKGFTRKDNFDSHVKLRHSRNDPPTAKRRKYRNPVKERKSVNQAKPRVSPRAHLSRRQQALVGEKQFECNQCSMRFSRADEVQAHMSLHVREKPFVCTQCNKRFVNNAGLLMHQKIHKVVHRNNGPSRKAKVNVSLMCRVCGLHCRSLEHLTTHEHTHEDRLTKCFVCGKNFAYVNHLKRHLLIHAGYRPHGCSYCSQKFSRMEHLKRHIRTHTRQGAYECSKCKKRFAKKIVFDRHVRLHNEDAPCLLDQRLYVNVNFQKQLESYIDDDDDDDDDDYHQDQDEDDYDEIKQEAGDYDEEEEPLLNVFPEVILGAET